MNEACERGRRGGGGSVATRRVGSFGLLFFFGGGGSREGTEKKFKQKIKEPKSIVK